MLTSFALLGVSIKFTCGDKLGDRSSDLQGIQRFFQKLVKLVNNIASLKTARIKITSNESFDREIAEKLSVRDKLFKKFKSSRFNIDWEIYKEARNDVQRTIKEKTVF